MHPDARRHLEAHIAGERSRDIDALMAPLSEHPRYVVPGWILDGREAIRAMYERALPLLSTELSDEYLRALDDPGVAHWGDDHIVLEYTDEYPRHRGMVVVVHFDAAGRVRSENTYFATPALLARYGAQSYEGIPGATRLRPTRAQGGHMHPVDQTDHIAILSLMMVGLLAKRMKELGHLDEATATHLHRLVNSVRVHAKASGIEDLNVLFENIDKSLS